MKRVLVTGATGCIGRHAIPALLARGWEVHAVSSREHANDADVIWHRANLLDAPQIESVVRAAKATHLLHLAWYIAPGRWAAAPENVDWTTASLQLLRSFHAHGGSRAVTAGSCLQYDWNYGYCHEDRTPRAPHTLYGVCKNAVETVGSGFSRTVGSGLSRTEQSGFEYASGRVFFLYGPFEHPDRLVASVIRSLIAGEPARCSHGRQVRDYLFADDVADAFVTLVESRLIGAVNIASGEAIALRDIVLRIADLVGRPDLVRLGAIPAAPTDTPLVVADVTRLRTELRWQPRFDLDQGLARTIEWWRQQARAPQPASL